jgi:hypothetical protein
VRTAIQTGQEIRTNIFYEAQFLASFYRGQEHLNLNCIVQCTDVLVILGCNARNDDVEVVIATKKHEKLEIFFDM